MDFIIVFGLVFIGLCWGLLIGNFVGQGMMIGYLLHSDDPNDVSVAKSWHDAFMWGREHEKNLFNRFVVTLVLIGINRKDA